MLTVFLAAYLFQAALATNSAPPPTATAASKSTAAKTSDPDPAALIKIKRIYVDSFGEDPTSKEMQSMIVTSLVGSKRFLVTENRERADAVLKGVALERSSQEVHALGDSTTVAGAAGGQHGEVSGTVIDGTGSISGSSNGGFVSRHMGISDSSLNTETVDRARISIRLVSSDGDVIWTITQESKGAKYKGASADAADLCIKQLLRDVSKLQSGDSEHDGNKQP